MAYQFLFKIFAAIAFGVGAILTIIAISAALPAWLPWLLIFAGLGFLTVGLMP